MDWVFGRNDPELLFSADPNGFYIGEVDGKRICHMNAVRYPKGNTYYIGYFITDAEYRGKGYGKKLFDLVWSLLDQDCNKILWCTSDLRSMYEKYGFHALWKDIFFVYSVKDVIETFKDVKIESTSSIQSITAVSLDKVVEFDNSVCKENRKSLLTKFISLPNSINFVAMDKNGCVLGYCVARKPINEEEYGWWVAPLFAVNQKIAKCLFKRVAEGILKLNGSSNEGRLSIFVPEDKVNRQANEIWRDLESLQVDEDEGQYYNYRMSTDRKYTSCMDYIYALTSVDIG